MARAHHDYGFFQVVMGSPEAGVAELRRAIALDPLSPHVNIDAGWVLLQAHHYEEAIRAGAQGSRTGARDEGGGGLHRARAGAAGKGAAHSGDRRGFGVLRGRWRSALAGRNEEALAALEQAFAEHSVLLVMLPTEPSFDRLRGDARFRGLMKRVGF